MNPDLDRLQLYPFERLAQLKQGLAPPGDLPHIPLSIGEPKHPTPGFITEEVLAHLHGMAVYPTTKGKLELREAVAGWLARRFSLPSGSLDPDRHILPVNGTREALFAIAQCVIDRRLNAATVLPNPFYQIYEGASILAGATPCFVSTGSRTGFIPDFRDVSEDVWQRCQLLYVCTPGNPTGAVIPVATLQSLIELADRHDFVIASDECYSEIYGDEEQPPASLLQAAAQMGRAGYQRCVVFNSLSKRSNVPGLRSGFVAGDERLIQRFLLYRTYHGCTMPPHTQAASAAAWQDEKHVIENRHRYRQKFDAVIAILSPLLEVHRPEGGFYLWPRTPGDDQQFTRELYARQNVSVLPGSYLSRAVDGVNPGQGHVRMALVAPLEECVEAARRISELLID